MTDETERNTAAYLRLCKATDDYEWDVLDETMAEDFIWHYGPDPVTGERSNRHVEIGREAFKSHAIPFLTSFDEHYTNVEQLIAVDDLVIARFREGGIWVRDIHGLRASGGPVEWSGIGIWRFENGVAVEEWFESSGFQTLRAAAGP